VTEKKGGALDTLISGGGSTTSASGKVYLGTAGGTKTITMKRSGKKIISPIEGAGAVTKADAKKRYFEDPTVQSGWLFTLKKNGYGDVSPIKAKALYDLAIEGAGKFYSQSGGTQKITPEQYLQWYAKDEGVLGGGGPSVSVQKYLFQPEEIQSLIDDTLKNVLGRKATQSESKEFYTSIQNMIDKGTITTTRKVGGKTVVETKPGYSKEKAEAMITEKVKAQSPQDYEEAQSLGFADFLGKLKG
jgi:hypothetical protein